MDDATKCSAFVARTFTRRPWVPCWANGRSSGATPSWPRATRSSRRCGSSSRRPLRSPTWRESRRSSGAGSARPWSCGRSLRHTAGLRAQDPARVPLDGRGRAPVGSRRSTERSTRNERGQGGLGAARVLSWDRQPRRNAWTRALIEELADAIESAGHEADARCIVVRGAGEHFSAGDDLFDALDADAGEWRRTVGLPAPHAGDDRGSRPGPRGNRRRVHRRGARVRGELHCASAPTGLASAPPRCGSAWSPPTPARSSPELLGETAARELLLTGEIFDAGWARTTGFVSEVVPAAELDERVSKLAAAFEADLSRRGRRH